MERAKSYEGEKVWSSINHSILSGLPESISLRDTLQYIDVAFGSLLYEYSMYSNAVVKSPKDTPQSRIFYSVRYWVLDNLRNVTINTCCCEKAKSKKGHIYI